MVGITSNTVEIPSGATGNVAIGSVTGGGGGPPPAANIAEFLDNLNPTHRWKCDEAAGPTLADSGTGTTRDLTQVGTLGYNLEGPDDSTLSIDGNTSSDWARNSVGGMDTAPTGTVLFFVRNIGTGVTVISNNNTSNETNQMQFGKSPVGVFVGQRIGAVKMAVGFVNRRGWSGSTDLTAFNTDNLWHLFGFTADGVGTMKQYVDGVEETVSTGTSGTPPADTAWLSGNTDANNRVVAFNGRFATGSGNNLGQQSEMCVINGTILTEAQFAELFALVTN